ncbi:MAG: hypothetical protein A4S14_07820 [Proteobacteria bacterium SG_bin9]|nr:MAG: hypothetical protein A4S14_07820 [Proteobacteria bacterium SG_bin9]
MFGWSAAARQMLVETAFRGILRACERMTSDPYLKELAGCFAAGLELGKSGDFAFRTDLGRPH